MNVHEKERNKMLGLIPFMAKKNMERGGRRGNEMMSIFDMFNEPFFTDMQMPMMSGGGFKVDVKDNGGAYELIADLPNVKKENINLSYENGYLTVSAQTSSDVDEKDEAGKYIRRERHVGSMSRSFYIDNIDETKINAAFKDGTLTVELPKIAEEQPKSTKIEIK